MFNQSVIAIQGEYGSYSEEAALLLLGPDIKIHRCKDFQETLFSVKRGDARCCLLPIENSLTGSIHKNYDLLLRHKLIILREVNLRIKHNLIGLPDSKFSEIKTVISHPVALDQCEQFFERFPKLTRKIAYDTSGSVKYVMDSGLRDSAAIASSRAAQLHNAKALMVGIEDNKKNFTRFVLLSNPSQLEPPPDANKVSIVFNFKNAPGALFKCLSAFAPQGIDLIKIESRPIHGRPWEYLFYLDFLGNTAEERTQSALKELKETADFIEVLGCYPGAPRQQKEEL